MKVAELTIYPVKSMQGLSGASMDVGPRGLSGDRRAMVVDAAGVFLTQRTVPALATIAVEEGADGLILTGPSGTIGVRKGEGRRTVTVWRDTVEVATSAPEVDAALSAWLGHEVALVHFDAWSARSVDPAWAAGETALSDGFPILVTNTASLTALNAAMADRSGAPPVGMERFRPNIVIETDTPFAEDNWRRLAIGDVELTLPKPCGRCIMTTLDQATGAARADNEPLATLTRTRITTLPGVSGPVFGQNALATVSGAIAVGAAVEVLETRATPLGFRVPRRAR